MLWHKLFSNQFILIGSWPSTFVNYDRGFYSIKKCIILNKTKTMKNILYCTTETNALQVHVVAVRPAPTEPIVTF